MDYFAWIDRHTRGRRPLEEEPPAREFPEAAPSEPIKVDEHHASTTVIERLREGVFRVLGKRS